MCCTQLVACLIQLYLLAQSLQVSGVANNDDDSAQLKNQLADIRAKLGEKTEEVTSHLTSISKLVCV